MGLRHFRPQPCKDASDATLVDFIENGGPQKKAMHAFANKGVSAGRSWQAGCLREDTEVVFALRLDLLQTGPSRPVWSCIPD